MIETIKTAGRSLLTSFLALSATVAFSPNAQARSTSGTAGVPFANFGPGGGGDSTPRWQSVAEQTGHLVNASTSTIVVEVALPVDVQGTFTPVFTVSNAPKC